MSNIASLAVASKKFVFFGIFVINHLKDKGIIPEDFDALSLDTSLVESFDPVAIQALFKQKNKKNSISLPVSSAPRENVLNAVANEYYANLAAVPEEDKDVADVVAAVPDVVATTVAVVEKPKRKNTKKSNAIANDDVVVDCIY